MALSIRHRKSGVRFVIWELPKKIYKDFVRAHERVIGHSLAVARATEKYSAGCCHPGYDTTLIQVYLKKPYTIGTLVHELFHAVTVNERLGQLTNEEQATIIGEVTDLVLDTQKS